MFASRALMGLAFASLLTWLLPAPAIDSPAKKSAAAPQTPSGPVDLYGDPLPEGVLYRLGTTRFRRAGWSPANGIAFSPDGKAIVRYQNQAVTRWDVATGKLLKSVEIDNFNTSAVARSPDGSLLAVAGLAFGPGKNGSVVRIWDTATLEERGSIELTGFPYQNTFAVAPDNRTIAMLGQFGGQQEIVRLYALSSGAMIREHKIPPTAVRWGGGNSACLAFSPDGNTLAISGTQESRNFLWQWRTQDEFRKLPYTERGAVQLAYAPDGKVLAAADEDGKWIRLWNVGSGTPLRTIAVPDGGAGFGSFLSFISEGKFLLSTGDRGKALYALDPLTGEALRKFDLPSTTSNAVAASRDGKKIAISSGAAIRIWNLDSGRSILPEATGHDESVNEVAFSPRTALIATAGFDGTVRIWDHGRQRHCLPHDGSIRALAFSRDGRLLATSSSTEAVLVWDTASGRQVYRLAGHAKFGLRLAVSFLADRPALASWGDDMYLRIWDTNTGKCLQEQRLRPGGEEPPEEDDDNPQAAMKRMQWQRSIGPSGFSPDGTRLVVSLANDYHVFDVPSGREIRHFPRPTPEMASAFALSPDGQTLAHETYRGQNSNGSTKPSTVLTVHLLRLTTGKVMQTISWQVSSSGAGLAFSPDGKQLATAAGESPSRVCIWETATGKEVLTLQGSAATTKCLAYSADGRQLACGFQDSTALVWNVLENLKR